MGVALIVPLICFAIAGAIAVWASRRPKTPPGDGETHVYVHVRTEAKEKKEPSRPRKYGYGKPRTSRKPQPYREDLDDYM